ncbi:MAG: hypothetical protein IPK85_12580 [Gemmatimonadetes bacterium]|nr:hypothetical protein [Gemmatimonadota bacterium]
MMRWVATGVLLASAVGCRSVNGAEEPVIRVEVILSQTTVAHGQPVGVAIRITNPSDHEVFLEGCQGSFYRVHDAAGRMVYPFPSNGVVGTCLGQAEPLASGANTTKRLAWATHRVSPTETNGVVTFVDPGVYEVRAAVRQTLATRDAEATPQRVTILPPTG